MSNPEEGLPEIQAGKAGSLEERQAAQVFKRSMLEIILTSRLSWKIGSREPSSSRTD